MEPLRDELKALEDAASANEKKAEDVEATIGALEKSIAKYKDEYAVLISQAQSIKADLASVEAKVCRLFLLTFSCSRPSTFCFFNRIHSTYIRL